MISRIVIFSLLFTVTLIGAQNKRILISGKINSTSLSVENIHVLNKNSGKGTISNKYGEFKIHAKDRDTLIVSGIQFYKKEVQITKHLIKNNSITIELFQRINELDEVQIKTHNLSGSLVTDANNIKDSISKVNPMALDLSMIDFSQKVILDKDEFARSRTSSDAQLMPNTGANLLAIAGLILDPLIKQIGKIGQRKKRLKHERFLYKKEAKETPNNIVDYLGESFFINKLKIPREEINDFIDHCRSKGIIHLYINNRKIEVIDILIRESKSYRNLKK